MSNLKHIQHTQFVERVLGIRVSLEQSCSLMEGVIPTSLHTKILAETMMYEGFLDGLAKKIGSIPTNIQKTFTNAIDVLKFIYNVLSDKTGENLQKGILILTRNSKALFGKIAKVIQTAPEQIKVVLTKIMDWLKSKVGSILVMKSDMDDKDDLVGDKANWKKFLLLLLSGCLVLAVYKLGSIVSDFGADVATDGLTKMLSNTQEVLKKLIQEPEVALASTGGPIIATILLPLFKLYAGAKILQAVNDELLDSNAWLRKS